MNRQSYRISVLKSNNDTDNTTINGIKRKIQTNNTKYRNSDDIDYAINITGE